MPDSCGVGCAGLSRCCQKSKRNIISRSSVPFAAFAGFSMGSNFTLGRQEAHGLGDQAKAGVVRSVLAFPRFGTASFGVVG